MMTGVIFLNNQTYFQQQTNQILIAKKIEGKWRRSEAVSHLLRGDTTAAWIAIRQVFFSEVLIAIRRILKTFYS